MTKKCGFSLPELLVTMAIVLILATLSYPSYTQQAARAKRRDAETTLMDIAGRLEAFYSLHDTYKSASLAALHSSNWSTGHNYQLNLTTTDDHYQIIAIPLKPHIQTCGKLSLNDQGKKSANKPNCW